MAALRTTTKLIAREYFRPSFSFRAASVGFSHLPLPASIFVGLGQRVESRSISCTPVRYAAAEDGKKKVPARLAQVHQLLLAAEERAKDGANEPIPKITVDQVTVNFARSGGPGGQNVNKVNTKVDMRFNVKSAHWLSERVRERIMQMEKNRVNRDGELVVSSTKTRTQKGNIEDALEKLQAIIDAASYVPPPPSEEQVKKIAKLAAIGEKKRLDKKKEQSQKKALRRSRDGWD